MESKIKIIKLYNSKGIVEKTFQKKSRVDLSSLKSGLYVIITEYTNHSQEKNLVFIK